VLSAEALFRICLDEADEALAQQFFPILADLLYQTASVQQMRLAKEFSIEAKCFEHTLLFAAVGKKRLCYLHVGDGVIIWENAGHVKVLSGPQRGEFANTTSFVKAAGPTSDLRKGLVSANDVSGLAVLTDGTAEKMLESSTNEPAKGFVQIWDRMREDTFGKMELTKFLTESFWEPSDKAPILDDRSLALLAGTVAPFSLYAKEDSDRGFSQIDSDESEKKPDLETTIKANQTPTVPPELSLSRENDNTRSALNGTRLWFGLVIVILLLIDTMAVYYFGRIALASRSQTPVKVESNREKQTSEAIPVVSPPAVQENSSTNPTPTNIPASKVNP
jgi:hypothetical protein